ncbi:MLP1-like [Asbolus verrucosus]|uniref:MLP1-like n=1 Tax=Asbolus verrucosus TaxID=1661398 RepID=A0A482V2P5_ASBVE|nr:MLP1-like [Asbolus verrucosus]
MDYVKEINELKDKIRSSTSEADFDNINQLQREIKNELLFKRNQVSQLRKELDAANSKIFELNKQLEINKSALKEVEFNFQLAIKKSSSAEEKMKEINESYTKMKLKEEMRTSEINILKENIQKTGHSNYQLTRDLEELQDKMKYYLAFQNELEDRQNKINATLGKMKDGMEKLENEHLKVMEFGKSVNCAEELKNLSQRLFQENEKLKKENVNLENKYIEASAQSEKLTNLIKNHKSVDMHKQNLISKIKFLQWEDRYKELQQKNAANEQLIEALTGTLNQEIETNAKLILKNDVYEAYIAELEMKFEVVETDRSANIKTELGEIVATE